MLEIDRYKPRRGARHQCADEPLEDCPIEDLAVRVTLPGGFVSE
jgi:hypothetical protein